MLASFRLLIIPFTKMAHQIKHIHISGKKLLVFGGVYSNLQALEALIKVAEQHNISPDNCICTGDIIGYCAQPKETLDTFKKWGCQSISGNVEVQLSEGEPHCGCDFKAGSRCDSFSQLWYPFAQQQLEPKHITFLKSLPDSIRFEFAGQTCSVVHGSHFNISEFIFKSTPWSIKAPNFKATNSSVILAGHCGLPFYHQTNNLLWLNAGVIGMPANDGSPQVWYAILEDINGQLAYKHYNLDYDFRTTSALMKQQNLPEEYARTIITGIWDNTEILPDIEKGLQGFGIPL